MPCVRALSSDNKMSEVRIHEIVIHKGSEIPELYAFGDNLEHLISNMLILKSEKGEFCKGKYLKFENSKGEFTAVDIGNVSKVEVAEWCYFPIW
jgi:hypothetical protein